MLAFRLLLASIIVAVLAYTGIVVSTQGLNFMPVFIRDIQAMQWPGQFNLDFSCLLLLSGLWIAWRHRFSMMGVLLGLVAAVGGAPVLCTYLLVESFRGGGDVAVLLLGEERAHRRG